MPLDKRPDAILYPQGLMDILQAKKVLGPVFGSKWVAVGKQGEQNFARPSDNPHKPPKNPDLLFPDGHPLAKTERYAWYEATRQGSDWSLGDEHDSHAENPSVVRFGYALPDPHADDEAVLRAVEGAMAAKLARKLDPEEQIARVERMRDRGIITLETAAARVAEIRDAAVKTAGDRPGHEPPEVRE